MLIVYAQAVDRLAYDRRLFTEKTNWSSNTSVEVTAAKWSNGESGQTTVSFLDQDD